MPHYRATQLTGNSLGKYSVVLLHVQKRPPLSRPLRTLKLNGDAMWVIHQVENYGLGLLGLEIDEQSKFIAVEDHTQNSSPQHYANRCPLPGKLSGHAGSTQGDSGRASLWHRLCLR